MKSLKHYVDKGLFYQSVVEDGSDIVFILDFSGKIFYHNQSAQYVLGHRPSSLTGKSFLDFLHEDSKKTFTNHLTASIKKSKTSSIEIQFLCQSKKYKFLEVNSINLNRRDGVEGLILDCRDITQRKEDAVKLLRAQKAKELFLANISHEIRTPINGISGMVTLLSKDKYSKDADIYLGAIKTASESLKVIINDILDLTSIESGKFRIEKIPFDISELISSLLDSFSHIAVEKNILLHYDLRDDVPKELVGDPVRLNQILSNLLSNALKFTPKGHIKLNCSIHKQKKELVEIKFEVNDTGIGIASSKQKSIFKSFSQGDPSVNRKYGGSGLGLTIAKQLVELQNGSISLKSEIHKGSTFTVLIPYPYVHKISTKTKKNPALQIKKNESLNAYILLVEDNEVNQIYASSLIKSWNCKCDIANNGKEALQFVSKQNYDIILMDLQMPEMDGHQATQKIRQSESAAIKKIPILAVTANATKDEIEKCIRSGMQACIAKPFTAEELFDALSDHLPNKARKIKDNTNSVKPDLHYLKKVGDAKLMREVINAYLKSLPGNLQRIKKMKVAKDWEGLKMVLHKTKPSLKLLGLPKLKSLAEYIEDQITAKRMKNFEKDFAAFYNGLVESGSQLKKLII